MANPSYSLDNINFTTLPGAYRFGGLPRAQEEEDIILESDSGKVYAYNQFVRYVYELHFRCTPTQLDAHEDMHLLVLGIYPFYFSLSGAGAADSVYVRKEPGFKPVELDSPGSRDSIFDYVLKMKTEIV